MAERAFPHEGRANFARFYPETPALVSHSLSAHPLLSLPALTALATRLPAHDIEYNPANLPIGIDPQRVPVPTLGIVDTLRSIETNGSWMVMKFIEQDEHYHALLTDTLSELSECVNETTGPMLNLQGFIFISSPGSVTPFHFDPEHNILMQVRGSKVMTVFPADNETIATPQAHESFHRGEHHRNLVWNEAFASCGTAFTLTPGDALHVPVKAPHWVQNGDAVSISLSVTWRSAWSYAEADARGFNHLLRARGYSPNSPGRFPARNLAKSIAFRGLRRLRLAR